MIDLNEFFWDALFPLVRLTGTGARTFLHGQISSDVLQTNESFSRCCWLSPVGRLRAILEIQLKDDYADFIVISGDHEEVINGFEKVIFPADKVQLEFIGEVRRIQQLSTNQSWRKTKFQWIYPNDISSQNSYHNPVASLNQIEEWRIRQGFPKIGAEIDAETNPLELGLADLVSLNKGCFLGQETLSKLSNLDTLKQELRFFHSSCKLNGCDRLVVNEEGNNRKNFAGKITSFYNSSDGFTIGLALIRRKYLSAKKIYLSDDLDLGHIDISFPIGFQKN